MKKKVLIVEDEFIVANNLRQVLERAGYEISDIAASAEETEHFIQRSRPDLALLDIRLQGLLTGIDIAKKLRAENIAFIYLSANSNQQILEDAKKTEPYGFLVKPFRKKDLLAMMDIAWYRHQNSLESKMQQEAVLQEKIALIGNSLMDPREKWLKVTKCLQPFLPFDLITCGPRPLDIDRFDDMGYLRIGFDEYQFIGEKELLTIANLKKTSLSVILANSLGDNEERSDIPSLHKILLETFQIESWLVFSVSLTKGRSFHYSFYSRQQHAYADDHLGFLNRLKAALTGLAENRMHDGAGGEALSEGSPGAREFRNIIGSHPLLLAALDLTTQVAPYETSVLILGESGTGKEKIAESIHLLSPRKTGPFIKVNCGAIPPTLIESELFGHEKGAFTGATERRMGRFQQAEGGTIFLDEVGELPLNMQVKILRVLQEKEIEYVGGSGQVRVNVRIIAATNRNLEKEVADGNFRLDLYYRLNVFPITLPPLRERKTDIGELAVYFAKKFCQEFNKTFTGIATSMMEEMNAWHWPGNIRELENVIEQSAILHDGKAQFVWRRNLALTATEFNVAAGVQTLEDVKRIQRQTEREYIISILQKTRGRIRGANGAAELMNLKPTTLEARIGKLDIRRKDFKRSAREV